MQTVIHRTKIMSKPFRHSDATHRLEQGTDLRYIQFLPGQNSAKTSEIYTHVSTKALHKIKSPLDTIAMGKELVNKQLEKQPHSVYKTHAFYTDVGSHFEKMKKVTTLTLATILWTICSAQNSSDTTGNKNFLYLNPLPFLNNTFQLNYERHLTKKIGLLLSGGYTLVDSYDDGKRGGNGEILLRIYLSDTQNKARRLFYFSPYARFQYIESTLGTYLWDNDKQEYYFVDWSDSYVSSYSGGLLIGFKWILKTRLTIDTYFGGGMKFSELNGANLVSTGFGDYYGYYTGPLPKLGILFGYNF